MCVPRRSKNFLLARISTGHYLQAQSPSTVIRGVHDSLNMKHNQVQRTNEWLYGYLHHNWNDWIIFCCPVQKSPVIYSLHVRKVSILSHSIIFEIAPTPDDEDSSRSFSEIKLQTIQIFLNASTCKEWNKYRNETDLGKYQLSNCCTSGLWNCPSH